GTPSFAGATTDGLDTVKVLVFKGTSATGPHRTLNATPEGSSWSTEIPVSEPLTSESYTAVAEQTEFEILGGIFETATTEPVTFTVDTQPPEVDITKGPEPRSNNVKPTFEGTASENTEVTVHIKHGEGEVSTATTKASGGKWSLTVSTALPPGDNKFTAYATEKSGIGNLDSKSEPPVSFEVDTERPE